jgi:hypothetical protein
MEIVGKQGGDKFNGRGYASSGQDNAPEEALIKSSLLQNFSFATGSVYRFFQRKNNQQPRPSGLNLTHKITPAIGGRQAG